MFFKLNQSKRFRNGELSFVLLSGICTALLGTTLLFAIISLILIKVSPDIDILINPVFLAFIILHFIAVLIAYPVYFFKAKKGVEINESEIVYHCGYYTYCLPSSFLKSHGVIRIEKIACAEYIDSFSRRELKKDYRNLNYVWYYLGNRIKSLPVAKLRVKTDNSDAIFIFPLENAKEFVDEVNSRL